MMIRILAALCSACVLTSATAATALAADPAAVCEAIKIQAAGKKYASKAKCTAKAVLKNVPVDAACMLKAEQKFVAAFLKADTKGVCAGETTAVEESIDVCLGDLLNQITPTTTTTDTTTTTTTTTTTSTTLPGFSGSIRFLEANYLNPGTSGTFYGQGIEMDIAFVDGAEVPAPVLEEQPGSPLGCKLWEYDPAETAAATLGVDEGPVSTAATGTGAPSLPDCTFDATYGYTCPHTSTFSTGGTIASGPIPGSATLTDMDVTYNSNNTSGRFLRISGATNASNNGLFPILALSGANSIIYRNPSFVSEALPVSATHMNFAGAGPTPGTSDPGFLPDDTSLTLTHTLGGGGHVPSFSAQTTTPPSVGDDFTLSAPELIKLNEVPTDGSGFSVACDASGCPGNSATGTLFEIVTTDGSLAGASAFGMPEPASLSVVIRCLSLTGAAAGSTMTVPPAYMSYVQTAGATRIRTTFARVTVLTGGDPDVGVLAGHAIVGFTNP